MGIVEQLTEKPWLSPGIHPGAPDGVGTRPVAMLTGLRLYFAVISVMFALIAAAYIMHRTMEHAPAGQLGTERALPLALLWLNSVALGCSSIAWERARRAARAGRAAAVGTPLTAAGMLAVLFLVGQVAAWWRIADAGGLAAGPNAAFFYLISALHGLHLLGGLVAWGRTMAWLIGGADAQRVGLSLRLCGDYWHFLLLVWLMMFALLVVT